MTTELWMLLGSLGTFFVLIMAQAMWSISHYGFVRLVGPRDDFPSPPPKMVGRFQRALRNYIESLIIFIPLVLTAHVVGISDSTTVLGAQLFFYSRIFHAVFYVAGTPWIRSIAFLGGVTGMVMIAISIISRGNI